MFSGQQQAPKSVTVVAKAGPLQGVTAYTDSYALFIGVGKYENPRIPLIPSAPNDATQMKNILARDFGFNPSHVEVLTDAQATKRNIDRAIAKLCDKKIVKSTDRVLVYFSCHGQGVPLPGGKEIGYLMPYDADVDLNDTENVSGFQTSCLKMDEIADRLEASPANHRALIVDACFSGFSTGSKALGATKFEPEALKKLLGERGLFIMTAGSKREEAAGSRSASGLSLYTQALINTLKEATINGGTYTAAQLFDESARKTLNLSKGAQNPQSSLKDGVGQMVFFAANAEAIGTPLSSPNTPPGTATKLSTIAGLNITCNAPGAVVEMDGKAVALNGTYELEPGGSKQVKIKVFAPRHLPEFYAVTLVTGQTIPLKVDLMRKPTASIAVTCNAANATVQVDGKPESLNPAVDLEPGETKKVQVVVAAPNYKRKRFEVTLVAGQSATINAELGIYNPLDYANFSLAATLSGHSANVSSVCYSPDGKTIASGCDDKTIKLWDAKAGALQTTLQGHSSSVNSVCFSPDGNTIASGSDDKTFKLWDTKTGTLKTTLTGHSRDVMSVCFSPDGNTIASGSWDKTIKLWDASTGRLKTTLKGNNSLSLLFSQGHNSLVFSVCFSPDGKTIASGSGDKSIKLWDASTGTLKTTLKDSNAVGSVCFSPDGDTIASGSGDKGIKLWDARTGTLKTTLTEVGNYVTSVCFSPDGNTIASVGGDKTIKLWDAKTGTLKTTLTGHISAVVSVCFSPDGQTLASGSSDNTIKFWRVKDED